MDSQNKWVQIVDKLKNKKLTIATMESCTGGGIVNEITNISGASSVLKESYITYCNEAKIKMGVPENIIKEYTVYSEQTAIEMAKTVKNKANSDIGIGITGQFSKITSKNSIDKLNYIWYAIINQNNEIIVKEEHIINDERKNQKNLIINKIAEVLLNCI